MSDRASSSPPQVNQRTFSNVSEWDILSDPPSPPQEHKHLIPPVNASYLNSLTVLCQHY